MDTASLRTLPGDAERVRLLKDVLRSTAKVASSGASPGGPGSPSGKSKAGSKIANDTGLETTFALEIKLVGAKGLRNADAGGASDPYCICQIPGKKKTKIRTKHVDNTLKPVWNHESTVHGWIIGDPLEFTVWDWDGDVGLDTDDLLGKAVLKSEEFYPEGFDGQIPLTEHHLGGERKKEKAYLTVEVRPRELGLQEVKEKEPTADEIKFQRGLDVEEMKGCEELDLEYAVMATGTLPGVNLSRGLDFEQEEEEKDSNLSVVLRDCGRRIGGLCHRLHATDAQVPIAPPYHGASGQPASGIYIVPRPEEATGSAHARAKADEAAAAHITKHSRFGQLEELKETIAKSKSFEELRRAFPRGAQHHPNLVLLTDYALQNRETFREAMWSTAPRDELTAATEAPGAFRLPGRAAGTLKSGTRQYGASLVGIGGTSSGLQNPGSRRLPKIGGMRKDASAPSLR